MVSGSTLSVLLGSWLRHQLGITSNFSRRGNPARLEGRRILRTLDSAWSLFQHGLAVLNLGYYDLQRWQANLYWILTFCVVRRACFRWLRWLAPDLSLLASATDQQVKCSAEAWTWTKCLMQNFSQAKNWSLKWPKHRSTSYAKQTHGLRNSWFVICHQHIFEIRTPAK